MGYLSFTGTIFFNSSVQIQACSFTALDLLKTNCDVKRKRCGDTRLSLWSLIETKNWKAMNFEYMSWLNLNVLCLCIISQHFLLSSLLIVSTLYMVHGSFVYCDDLLVS